VERLGELHAVEDEGDRRVSLRKDATELEPLDRLPVHLDQALAGPDLAELDDAAGARTPAVDERGSWLGSSGSGPPS